MAGIDASAAWRSTFPDAHVGCLLLHGVSNAERDPALDERLAALQTELRARYASADRAVLADLPVVRAYQAHYRAFGQTYHVLRQLESVAVKGRALASPGGTLVSAMFAAGLRSLLLTPARMWRPWCRHCWSIATRPAIGLSASTVRTAT